MFILRERARMSGGGAEREGDTESKAGSRLRAISTEPNVGLKPTNSKMMTWAQVGHSTDWATQVPLFIFLMFIFERERAWMSACVCARAHEQGRGRERGRQDLKWALCWQQRAWCGARIHKLWDHYLSRSRMLNQLSHPGAPRRLLTLKTTSKQK